MEIEVSIADKHKITVSTPNPDTIPFRVTNRKINLRDDSLFTHPFEPQHSTSADAVGADVTFTELKRSSIAIFRMLGFADERNPLVQSLTAYYEQTLDNSLHEIYRSPERCASEITSQISSLAESPAALQKYYGRIFDRISEEMPFFFHQEHQLGTIGFLKTHANSALPFAVAERPQLGTYKNSGRILKGTGFIYNIDFNTAFIEETHRSSVVRVLESLALSGTTGESTALLNKIAALSKIYSRVPQSIENIEGTMRQKRMSSIRCFASSLCNGVFAFAALPSFQYAHQLISDQHFFSGVTIGSFGGMLALAGVASQFCTFDRWKQAAGQYERDTRLDEFFLSKTTDVSPSLTSLVLLHALECRGSSRKETPLNPQQTKRWETLLGQVKEPQPPYTESDLNQREVTLWCDDIPFESSALDSHCEKNLVRTILSELQRISEIEVLDKNWQMIQALETAAAFTSRNQSYYCPDEFSSLMQLLPQGQFSISHQNQAGNPALINAFKQMLSFHQLDPETWAFVAKPLMAADIIEQSRASRVAARIACEELFAA